MGSTQHSGHDYHHIQIGGSSRAHLGDVHYNYGQSPDEQTLHGILDSLSYPGMNDRRDAIVEAHEGTYDWTFLESDTNNSTDFFEVNKKERQRDFRTRFETWLQDDSQGLFLFTGKPGSGKSTLMKKFAYNWEVVDASQGWASGRALVRADHFFWILGTPAQKSLEGMLRSLLYSVIRAMLSAGIAENLEAIRLVCGDRWLSKNVHRSWARAELKDMITRLSSLPDIRIFFLIDALDECEPQDSLHELATEVLRISRLANVKICASCRPWKAFTTTFAHCPNLRLEQLTYDDMETYVRSRFLAAEAEGGFQTEIHDGSRSAKHFISRVVYAAEGVFLWTKLVTDELCSELRKGRSIDTLDETLSHIPTSLDDYFHKLILDRIGKSQQNVIDTAAALRLAMEILVAEETVNYPRRELQSAFPFSQHFINFWLLGNHHLGAGFSWKDHQHIALYPMESMKKQTESFLREACNDLLIIYPYSHNVGFFHRTVFDYLFDNPLLVQNAPGHFGDENFISELARLRCVCILQKEHRDCSDLLLALDSIFRDDLLVYTAPWALRCETLVKSQIHSICTCYGLQHLSFRACPRRLMAAGFDGFICGELDLMPHLAICKESSGGTAVGGCDSYLLGHALQATNAIGIQGSRYATIRKMLECGSDPNASSGYWPRFRDERAHFSSQEPCHLSLSRLSWCWRSHWQAWLGESYLQLKSFAGDTVHFKHRDPMHVTLHTLKRNIAVIVELLLLHGADPCRSICITEHRNNLPVEICTEISLQELLRHVVPTESMPHLQELRKRCASKVHIYTLRRNQRRRAARSFITSLQNIESNSSPSQESLAKCTRDFQTRCLRGMMNEASSWVSCCICRQRINTMRLPPALVVWCIECGGLASKCFTCLRQRPALEPTLTYPCGSFAGTRSAQAQGHTNVAVAFRLEEKLYGSPHEVTRAYVDSLEAEYGTAQAVFVIKEWYAKNPIEPDLSLEEVLAEIPEEDEIPKEGEARQQCSNSGRSGRRSLATLLSRFKRGSNRDDGQKLDEHLSNELLA